MSVRLLDEALAFVRAAFTKQEVVTVEAYGGQFGSGEVDRVSFASPAIFITVLGWAKPREPGRLQGATTRAVRMAAFVVTKAAKREGRMRQAMGLAEALALKLRNWQPGDTAALRIAALEADPACENLYSQAMDKDGLALWLVDWEQLVQPKPDYATALLGDLRSIEITSEVAQGQAPASPAPSPAPAPITVTQGITFNPLPPAA